MAGHPRNNTLPHRWKALLRAVVCFLFLLAVLGKPSGATLARRPAALADPLTVAGGVKSGAVAWGDYDNDDDLDLLMVGLDERFRPAALLFNNQGGMLSRVTSGLPGAEDSSVDWGDYDQDGYLDVLITGQVGVSAGEIRGMAQIWRNNHDGTFSRAVSLPPVYHGAGRWGDMDSDGDLDILLTGYYTDGAPGDTPMTNIYRNDGGTFTELAGLDLPGAGYSDAAWADYDRDEDLDFVLIGKTDATHSITRIYRNDGGDVFTRHPTFAPPGMWDGAIAWVDYNDDNALDLVLTGNTGTNNGSDRQPRTFFYRYNSEHFFYIAHGIEDVWESSVSPGDYDNDGDVDLLVNGMTLTQQVTRIFLNNQGEYSGQSVSLPLGSALSVAWGDATGDGSLDIAVTGYAAGTPPNETFITRFYRNLPESPNAPPAAPQPLASCYREGEPLMLFWTEAVDDHTRGVALTYNLRVGTAPGQADVLMPPSSLETGFYRRAGLGQVGTEPNAMLSGLTGDTYYWSVQGVDASYQGGPFSAETRFETNGVVGTDDSFTTEEDQPVELAVLANDSAAYGPLKVIGVPNRSAHGELEITLNGTRVLYRPDQNFSGTDTFTYYPASAEGRCSPAAVSIQVGAINDPPYDIKLSNNHLPENSPFGELVGTLSADDPDDASGFTFSMATGGPDNAFFKILGNELHVLQPADAEDPDHPYLEYHIRIRVEDPDGEGFEKDLTVYLIGVNEYATSIERDGEAVESAAVRMSEDGTAGDGTADPFALTLVAADDDRGETLTWTVSAAPQHGTVRLTGGTAGNQPLAVGYTPTANWFGSDAFTLSVTDGAHTDSIDISVTVDPVNDRPTFNAIPAQTLPPGTTEHTITVSGISPGPFGEESQPLLLSAATDNPDLITGLPTDQPVTGSSASFTFQLARPTGAGIVHVTLREDAPDGAERTSSFQVRLEEGYWIFLPLVENE